MRLEENALDASAAVDFALEPTGVLVEPDLALEVIRNRREGDIGLSSVDCEVS